MLSDETVSVRSVHPTFDDTKNLLAIPLYLAGGMPQCQQAQHRETETVRTQRRVGRPVPERALPINTVSDANGGGVGRVATAVHTSPTGPDQLESLLRRLLPTPVLPTPPPKPVPSNLELLLQRLGGGGCRHQSLPYQLRWG